MAEFVKIGGHYFAVDQIVEVHDGTHDNRASVKVVNSVDWTRLYDKDRERFLRWLHHQARIVDLDE